MRPELDVFQARSLLETTQAQVPELESELAQTDPSHRRVAWSRARRTQRRALRYGADSGHRGSRCDRGADSRRPAFGSAPAAA